MRSAHHCEQDSSLLLPMRFGRCRAPSSGLATSPASGASRRTAATPSLSRPLGGCSTLRVAAKHAGARNTGYMLRSCLPSCPQPGLRQHGSRTRRTSHRARLFKPARGGQAQRRNHKSRELLRGRNCKQARERLHGCGAASASPGGHGGVAAKSRPRGCGFWAAWAAGAKPQLGGRAAA